MTIDQIKEVKNLQKVMDLRTGEEYFFNHYDEEMIGAMCTDEKGVVTWISLENLQVIKE